jgi:hypothetical protein
VEPRRWPILQNDGQRDLPFYRLVVSFRNAVELMMIKRGKPLDPDHLFWGFGGYEHRPRPRRDDDEWPGDEWPDDDGLAGSRVPKLPYGGMGGASVELEPPFEKSPQEEQIQHSP